MVLKTDLQVALKQGVMFGQCLGSKSSVVKETRKVAYLENLSGFKELLVFANKISMSSWNVPGAPCKPKGIHKGLRILPLGRQKEHRSLALSDNDTCQKPDLMSSFDLYRVAARDSIICSIQGKYAACGLHLAINFLNCNTISRVWSLFYQPGTWANKLRGIFQGDRPQPGQPLLVPQLGVPVPLDLPSAWANISALGPFLPIQVSGSSPFVPGGRLPVKEVTGQRLPCI